MDMFTLQATYAGYTGETLWVSYSLDNYVILYADSPVHMFQKEDRHLLAPSDNFPLAINPKELSTYNGRGSWRDYAFNMSGDPIAFLDNGMIALAENTSRMLCLRAGDDRRVHWSDTPNDPETHYLVFTKVAYSG